jgi:hypothetical protein
LKVIYVDTTNNENNEIGFKNEVDFRLPASGTIINIENKKYEFKSASKDNQKDVNYLYLQRL